MWETWVPSLRWEDSPGGLLRSSVKGTHVGRRVQTRLLFWSFSYLFTFAELLGVAFGRKPPEGKCNQPHPPFLSSEELLSTPTSIVLSM